MTFITNIYTAADAIFPGTFIGASYHLTRAAADAAAARANAKGFQTWVEVVSD
jgi:hypothetical protein